MNKKCVSFRGCMKDKANAIYRLCSLLHIASTRETSWNNPPLHLVFLPQRMGLFLLPLFSTREARGCIFPSLDGRSAYVELISFAFPHSCVPLLAPARPAAGCPWCCLARRAYRCLQQRLHTSHLRSWQTTAAAPFLLAK